MIIKEEKKLYNKNQTLTLLITCNIFIILLLYTTFLISYFFSYDSDNYKVLALQPTVSNDRNQSIIQIPYEYKFVRGWGSEGSALGQFNIPWNIDIDAKGNLYVADSLNNRIQKFDSEGNFITKWGSFGNGSGQFKNPTGIAIDSKGSLYVADSYNNRIQKFDSEGNFITKWELRDNGKTEFQRPVAIIVDPKTNNVYVVDGDNHRIQMFTQKLND